MKLTPVVSVSDVSYETYCRVLDNMALTSQGVILAGGVWDGISNRIASDLVSKLEKMHEWIDEAQQKYDLELTDIIIALKQKDVFKVLSALRFNLTKILRAVREMSHLISKGLIKTFELIANSPTMQKIREGTAKVDDLLNEYPVLKGLTGLALAGLLFWMWLNMSFIGDFEYDMDLSTVIDAFQGKFTLTDLFTSPQGVAAIGLFALGTLTGLSVPWLGKNIPNLFLAVLYTGFKRARKAAPLPTLKRHMQFKTI
jgi:hypothetical protein